MSKDSGHTLQRLAVDGGMSNSEICMQTQSDLIGIPVDRPAMRETTALGAAFAAGIGAGIWKEVSELKEEAGWDGDVFEPRLKSEEAKGKVERWEKAVEKARGFV
jgi:glycerol kinase